MDERNYGSLEACQRLYAAGIVPETEVWWRLSRSGHNASLTRVNKHTDCHCEDLRRYIPAPSMAEAWRRLPAMSVIGKDYGEVTYVAFKKDYKISNANPTDALIDLLIWWKQTEGGKP